MPDQLATLALPGLPGALPSPVAANPIGVVSDPLPFATVLDGACGYEPDMALPAAKLLPTVPLPADLPAHQPQELPEPGTDLPLDLPALAASLPAPAAAMFSPQRANLPALLSPAEPKAELTAESGGAAERASEPAVASMTRPRARFAGTPHAPASPLQTTATSRAAPSDSASARSATLPAKAEPDIAVPELAHVAARQAPAAPRAVGGLLSRTQMVAPDQPHVLEPIVDAVEPEAAAPKLDRKDDARSDPEHPLQVAPPLPDATPAPPFVPTNWTAAPVPAPPMRADERSSTPAPVVLMPRAEGAPVPRPVRLTTPVFERMEQVPAVSVPPQPQSAPFDLPPAGHASTDLSPTFAGRPDAAERFKAEPPIARLAGVDPALPPELVREITRAIAREVGGSSPAVSLEPLAAPAPIAQAPAAPAPSLVPAPTIDTPPPGWMDAMIGGNAELPQADGRRGAELRLAPDALGIVEVRIAPREDGMHISLDAQTSEARALLVDAAPRLQELAEARGLRIAEPQIGGGGSQLAQGQGEQRRPSSDQPAAPRPATPSPDDDTDTPGELIA